MIWPRQSYPDLGLYYGIIISRVKKIIVSIHSIRPHLGITISVCKLEPLQKKATKMVKEFQKHVIWETAKEMGVLNWETRRLENIKSWLYSIWRMARKTRIRFLSRPKGKHWWFSLQKRKSSSCRSTLAYYTWRSVSYSVMSDSATPWTVTRPALLSIEFSRQEIQEWVATSLSWGSSWPRDSGIKPRSPALQADSLQSEPPREAHTCKRIDGISKSAVHGLKSLPPARIINGH